ncbi:MAG: DoxX family membrane protein [Chitinophagaceae bacterium]|nr:DoxX family membrane protein [Chitinophagaceae bacterium]
MKKTLIVDIISGLLILLFVYAGLSKLLDYADFKFQLSRSPFVTKVAGLVAWAVPASEIVVALLLVFNRTRLLGFYASFFLMLLFTGYIYAMLHYSYYVPCSCGGVLSQMSWGQHLIFNIAFTILAFLGVVMYEPVNTKQQKDEILYDI